MTYVLMAVVALIWSLIGYRVYSALSSGDDTIEFKPPKFVKVGFNDYSLTKDTMRLLLNYRDPFGLSVPKDTIKIVKTHPVNHTSRPSAPQLNWEFIKYSGYLRNPGTKKLIAFLTINGKNVTITEGETIENVRLLKNLRDSIKISFNGKIKFIPLHF